MQFDVILSNVTIFQGLTLAQVFKKLLNIYNQLIKTKYNVVVPENDIQACHYLPNNTILVRFWNRKEGSPWDHLTTEIKKGGKKEVGLYANFQLTNKRNSLMYHLRSMKKEGKISKLSLMRMVS